MKHFLLLIIVIITSSYLSKELQNNSNGSIYDKLDTAVSLMNSGEYQKSIYLLHRLFKKHNNKNTTKIYYNLAKNHYFLNQEDSSIFYLTKILLNKTLDLKTEADSYLLLSSNYSLKSQLKLEQNIMILLV